MRSDVLSRRLFYAGCCGLPWLWVVHVWYWKTYVQGNEDHDHNPDVLLNPDDRK
jgi:Presenilin enhancer-2 subunit of gamma secretase